MPPVTKTQLDNAAIDADNLAAIANDAGTVTTRTGGDVRSAKQVISDIASTAPAKPYDTEAALLADLVPVNATLAYARDTDRYYVKNGATGTGSWDTTTLRHEDNVSAALNTYSLFVDPHFELSANNASYSFDGAPIFNSGLSNWAWDATVEHLYGTGAWKHDSALTTLSGANTWFDKDYNSFLHVEPGDKVSIGAIVRGATVGGRIGVAHRFFNQTGGTYVSGQVSQTFDATGEEQLVMFNDITVPAGAYGVVVYIYDGTPATDVHVLKHWVVPGKAAGVAPPINLLPDVQANIDASNIENNATFLATNDELRRDANRDLTSFIDDVVDLSNPVYSNGTHSGYQSFSSTFNGWAMPFDWDGTAFDIVRININVETADTTVEVAVWTGDKSTLLGKGQVLAVTKTGVAYVKLNNRVTTTLTPAGVLYVAKYTVPGDVRMESDAVAGTVHVSDPASYPQLYDTITAPNPDLATWPLVTGAGTSRPIAYALFDSQTFVEKTGDTSSPDNPNALTAPKPGVPVTTPRIYGMEGLQTNVYLNDLISGNPATKSFDCVGSSSLGQQQDERWTISPTDAAINGTGLTINVYDRDELETLLGTAAYNVWSVANDAAAGVGRRVCCIGDSTTNAGLWTQRMVDLDAAYAQAVQLTMVGTRGSGANLHEGRGGWRMDNYFQPSETLWNGTPYREENPFTQNAGDKFNASFYLTDTGQAAPDIVVWHLGINDIFGQTSDAGVNTLMNTFLDQLDRMIGVTADNDVVSWKEVNANVVNLVALPISPSGHQDSFGNNYTVVQNRNRYKRNITVAAHRIAEHYANSESDKVFLVPWNVVIDPERSWTTTNALANSHTTDTVDRHNNGVHPSGDGYAQMGDQMFAAINALVVNGLA
jgi:lysophospholipase L1-like esterase